MKAYGRKCVTDFWLLFYDRHKILRNYSKGSIYQKKEKLPVRRRT
jgi:hypothetical protein